MAERPAAAPPPGARPVLFDLTHLVSRLPKRPTSGIDRIDLAYATHFAGDAIGPVAHYGLRNPHLIPAPEAAALVRLSRSLWDSEETGGGEGFRDVREWLAASPAEGRPKPRRRGVSADAIAGLVRRLHQARGRLLHDRKLTAPYRAIYLNVAQHLFEHPVFFRWIAGRDDLRAVFMIHDLLPLDYPEYFSAPNLGIFRRRIATALTYAHAFLVSTSVVKARLEREFRTQGVPPRPIHVQPFPSPLGAGSSPPGRPAAGHPYFVALGTIEPRKNHLMLLHLWRRLAARDPQAPRLVIVGARGWENEQVADILDRSLTVERHVFELSGLPSTNLADLIRGSRGLLAPSFDEGYGLPVVESLSLGAPVVASDIAVFREVTQGKATFLSPLDGLAWSSAVERLAHDDAFLAEKRAEAARFVPPTWPEHFAALEAFLASL
jgi:glycosyltransferase involved in cell wall biosynthesis